MKAEYIKPVLTAHGSVEKITQQTRAGKRTDALVPAGTPLNEIPLS